MKPHDLLDLARLLTRTTSHRTNAVFIRRAASSVYYALFHFLAAECANQLMGKRGKRAKPEAWRQVYRALDHGSLRARCQNKEIIPLFPKEIQDFANHLVSMQAKRHEADYDPFALITEHAVMTDIDLSYQTMEDFSKVPAQDRRAFCVWILLKDRKS